MAGRPTETGGKGEPRHQTRRPDSARGGDRNRSARAHGVTEDRVGIVPRIWQTTIGRLRRALQRQGVDIDSM